MRARSRFAVIPVTVVLLGSVALAGNPKVKPVDISAYKDKLEIFTDDIGGTYAVFRDGSVRKVFYGEAKTLYEQRVVGGGRNGEAWSVDTYAPRVPNNLRGGIERKQDGTYVKVCYGDEDVVLTPITGAPAKAVLDKYKFVTTATFYLPYALGRDDRGVYYYVDQLQSQYGGKGFRLFIGKKGKMKQATLTDVSDDTMGAVFSTRAGDLSFTFGPADDPNVIGGSTSDTLTWTRGEKSTKLVQLGTYANTALIHTDLGIYKFLGTLCDSPPPEQIITPLPK